MRFELIIVSYKAERWLARCLASIYYGDFRGRCWLIDNDTLEASVLNDLRSAHPGLEYLHTGENLGFGTANNIGIERSLAAGADVVGLVNPDIWFEPGWYSALMEAFLDPRNSA